MTLDNLLMGTASAPSTYSMALDPIYGPLFQAQIGRPQQPQRPGGGGGLGGVPPGGGSPSHWEQVASQLANRKFGWGPNQFKYLDWIISGGGPNDVVAESHWNPGAVNPNGGASGIPQMLPSAHPDINVQQFRNNPMMQIRWLLNYVKGRYGDPQSAYQAKSQQGWY